MPPVSRFPLVAVLGVLLGILGIGIALAGAWLMALGGSACYLAAGILMLACAALVLARSAAALGACALLLGGTLAWALWESGLDWWPLAARLDLPFVIGLLIITPWVRRRLDRPAAPSLRSPAALALCAALAATLVASGAAWMRDPHDLAGALPAAPASPIGEDAAAQIVPAGEWRAHGRTAYGQRYSPLAGITPDNVAGLTEVWRYRSGDARGNPGEATPLKAGWRIYLCTPGQSVIALHPTNGIQLWRRDIRMPGDMAKQRLACPGVSYQPPFSEPVIAGGDCASKIFMPAADGRLLVMDTETGAPCVKFGGKGEIDPWAEMPDRRPGAGSTPLLVLTRKLAIARGAGVIRAFDIDTGAPVWTRDSGADSPNSRLVPSVDETLGMVYVPMGKSLAALELASGQLRWTFPAIASAQPALVDLSAAPALVLPAEQGELFVLDRRTGKPMARLSLGAAPMAARDAGGVTLLDQLACRIAFQRRRDPDVFSSGGAAVDPQRGIAFVARSNGTVIAPLGIACKAPGRNYIAGVDLAGGKLVWKHRIGSAGMPMITAGGVAFLSGAIDDGVRAYDVVSGRQLWESRMPARGHGTPITYTGDEDRQFLAVAAGDYVIAYGLPKK